MDEKGFYRRVGELLQARRRAMKLTQAALAEASGVRRTSIANVEAGRQSIPVHMLYQLAVALGTDIASLIPPTEKTLPSNLMSVEVDGRMVNVTPRSADFLRRMREDEDKDDVDPG